MVFFAIEVGGYR